MECKPYHYKNENDPWLIQVNQIMLQRYCIDSCDAGWDEAEIQRFRAYALSPEEFVEWYGEKYDLLNFHY